MLKHITVQRRRNAPRFVRRLISTSLLAPAIALSTGCSDAVAPAPPEPPTPTGPPEYVVRPPAGKLPWPHHNPGWNSAQYNTMLEGIWVVNNFGLYQGTSDRAMLYLHDALDIVLPNGTPIHAVESGIVRANIGGNEFYRTLVVESDSAPGYGWGYTHIFNFTVLPGERVEQGTQLGVVNFQGLEHIHLTRLKLAEGGRWNSFQSFIALQPDAFFVYTDTEPPVFEGRFRYVRNNTDTPFLAQAPDTVVTVSGEVDIVVGLRDPGEWARSKQSPPYGDRNAPSRVEYDIVSADGVRHSFLGFDLSRVALTRDYSYNAPLQVLTLYQHYESVRPAAPPAGNNHARFNYYIITNSDGGDYTEMRDIYPADAGHSWNTSERLPDGSRRYPNGEYVITVRAYDAAGNMSTRSETVRVAN